MAGRNAKAFEAKTVGHEVPDLNTAGAYRTALLGGKEVANVCCPCGCGVQVGFERLPKSGETKLHIEYGDHLWMGGLEDGMWVEDVDAKPVDTKV